MAAGAARARIVDLAFCYTAQAVSTPVIQALAAA
jgi:hypothetical protein